MFIRGAGPFGLGFNQGQSPWGLKPDPAFAFDLTNPDFFLNQNLQYLYALAGKQAAFRAGLQSMATNRSSPDNFNLQKPEAQQHQLQANDFDQSMVWFQNMEDPNEAFRGPTHPALNEFTLATGHSSHHVSLQPSSSNNHGSVHARRQTNLNSSIGGLKPEPNIANAEPLWSANTNSANVNHNFSQSVNARGSQKWPTVPCPNNAYMQAYGFPEGLAHGLPILPNDQAVGPSFDLGQAMGAVPNVDSSSSSSCRVIGSSPNTVFGSFSSSIGPQDMMDMDVADECLHSPSVFPAEAPCCQNPGNIPQAFLSRSPDHNFGITPGVVFPEADTVSPKMLHLNNVPTLPSSSSSESLHNPFRMDSDTDVASAVAVHQTAAVSSSAQQTKPGSVPKVNKAPRKLLPDKAPGSKVTGPSIAPKRRHGGEAGGDKAPAPSSKKSKAKSRGSSQSHSQPQSKSDSGHHHQRRRGGSDPDAKTHHGKASSSKAAAASSASSSGASAEAPATPPRSERDEYLVKSKLAGMTYKEIRKQGNFTEAESTLRGRFRTLTKPKEARVRKPEFQEIDDKLLKRAVVKFTKDADEITRDSVPWKLVSEYMYDHGGSYLFGYTTVRKRWEYLMVTSEEQVRQDRLDQQQSQP